MTSSNGLVSKSIDNSQWVVKGDLLLPKSFEENASEEAQLGETEEAESDELEDSETPEEVAGKEPAPVPVPTPVSRASASQAHNPPVAPTSVQATAIAAPVKRVEVKPAEELPTKFWVILASVLVGGFLLIVWFNRPQAKSSGSLPNTNNPQQPQMVSQGQGQPRPPTIDINAYEQARNTKFKEALQKARAAWGSCGRVCQARRDHYLDKAIANLQAGVPVEVTLLRELNRQIGEQTKILPYNAELGGFATKDLDQIGVARSLSGDALAILEALDWEWTRQAQEAAGQTLPARTTTTVDLAPLSSDMATLWQLAALTRNGKPQQNLRDSVVFDRPPAKEELAKSSDKKKDKKSEAKSETETEGVGLPK
ncbi:hypothetical protein NDA01_21625 [Trichocoleus desertorum AS-A10]|uniref:hypothetical protein n=1 Tax=Trichocoleus desertorum TaxID=1481672 RepID=UPI003296B640